MRFDKYKGYNDDIKYKEGVLTVLETLLEEVRDLKAILTPKEIETVVEPVIEVKKAPKPKKKKEVIKDATNN